MRPILPGSRGPAVEDIQRRLLRLGYPLGPTGVDGVFLGMTTDAVRSFQTTLGLSEDGVVGDDTWAALVDETFTLGDRTLYLRLPHFHGKDVSLAQEALNALGFVCGDPDAIFGAHTERAVREFQRNSGIPADGILGAATIGALKALRHVWEGKDSTIPTGVLGGPARSTEVLAGLRLRIGSSEPAAAVIADRVVNLAQASAPGCSIRLEGDHDAPVDGLLVNVAMHGAHVPGVPVVSLDVGSFPALVKRLVAAHEVGASEGLCIELPASESTQEPESAQRIAVLLLDALCAALA